MLLIIIAYLLLFNSSTNGDNVPFNIKVNGMVYPCRVGDRGLWSGLWKPLAGCLGCRKSTSSCITGFNGTWSDKIDFSESWGSSFQLSLVKELNKNIGQEMGVDFYGEKVTQITTSCRTESGGDVRIWIKQKMIWLDVQCFYYVTPFRLRKLPWMRIDAPINDNLEIGCGFNEDRDGKDSTKCWINKGIGGRSIDDQNSDGIIVEKPLTSSYNVIRAV